MRYVKILSLTFQHVLEYKARSFVWFLTMLVNPFLILLFWRGISAASSIPGWTASSITSYYLLITIASALLESHIEEDISRDDVGKGMLSMYLMKPISYYWKKFIEEIPYRIVQGVYGIIIAVILVIVFGNFSLTNSFSIFLIGLCCWVLAIFLSFTMKMIIGIISIWMTDIEGIIQFHEIIRLVFAGLIVPLYLLPSGISLLAKILPFSYVIYFPVAIIQGKLSFTDSLFSLGIQVIWIFMFAVIYLILWNNGIKKFSGVGQ